MDKTITVQELKGLQDAGADITLLDVRRKTDREADPAAIPGALWRDPEAIQSWSAELTPGAEVILYCARGGSVSKSVLDTLLAKNFSARYVEGGIAAWKQAGAGTEKR